MTKLCAAAVCFATVAYMIYRNIAHNWYSTDLMIAAYLVPVPIFLFGCFWGLWFLAELTEPQEEKRDG